jgi:hypothetical protein
MAKRTLTFLIMAMACFGLARAADIPAEILIPTVLGPPELIILASAPAPDLTDLRLPETVFVSQSNPAVLNPFGGFGPAPDPGKPLFDVNLVALVALNIADYASTREALKYPGLHEFNPLVAPFARNPAAFAAVKIGTTALTYWCMKALFKKNRTMAWVLTTASNLVLSYAVANNLQMIQRARSR